MSMFTDISYGTKDNEENVWQMPISYLCTREDLEKDNGHLLVLVMKKWYCISDYIRRVYLPYSKIL